MHLIRHGQSEFNAQMERHGRDPGIPDPPLTSKGVRQAEVAVTELRGLGIKTIVSSPYCRALQTASIIAAALELKIQIEPLAGEKRLYSCDIGSPGSVLRPQWPTLELTHITEDWWHPPTESNADLMRRVTAFRAKYAATENLLVVSHWYFIYAMTGQDMENGEIVHVM